MRANMVHVVHNGMNLNSTCLLMKIQRALSVDTYSKDLMHAHKI